MNDDYIYAVLPEKITDINTDIGRQAQIEGTKLVNETIAKLTQKAENALLDKFDKIFGGKKKDEPIPNAKTL